MRSDLIALVNTDHLLHNYRALRARCRPGVRFCAPLKADAYGHGVRVVAPILDAAGAEYAAVATLEEATQLRGLGWRPPILILGNVLAVADARERRERIDAIVEHGLAVTLADEDTVLNVVRAEPRRRIAAHIKFDSGMGRMGATRDAIGSLVRAAVRAYCLNVVGFYSQLATADLESRDAALRQLEVFEQHWKDLSEDLPPGVIRHIANSAATIALPEAHLDMVRPGLALYGYAPADHISERIDLKPVLRWVSHLTAVKQLPSGTCVGYGHTFTTERPTRLGIVPAGYFDGLPRALSNTATVGTPHGDAPVIGRISMDQLAVDLTDLPPMALGTEVVLIDERPGRPNSVAAIARTLGTIPYEVTCLLGPRIQRVAVGKSCASEVAAPSGGGNAGETPVLPRSWDAR